MAPVPNHPSHAVSLVSQTSDSEPYFFSLNMARRFSAPPRSLTSFGVSRRHTANAMQALAMAGSAAPTLAFASTIPRGRSEATSAAVLRPWSRGA